MSTPSAARLRELSDRWKNFDIERERARKDLGQAVAQAEEIIREQREHIQELGREFDAEWTGRREQIRADRDREIKELLKSGASQAEVMRIMESNNTQLIGRLWKEAKLEQSEEERAKVMTEATPEPQEDAQIEGVKWFAHFHTGVHGWMLSGDRTMYKRFDTAAEEPGEAEWYVASVSGNLYLAGSKAFYDRADMSGVEKRLGMLGQLLDGTYTGRLNLKPSPYAAA